MENHYPIILVYSWQHVRPSVLQALEARFLKRHFALSFFRVHQQLSEYFLYLNVILC